MLNEQWIKDLAQIDNCHVECIQSMDMTKCIVSFNQSLSTLIHECKIPSSVTSQQNL